MTQQCSTKKKRICRETEEAAIPDKIREEDKYQNTQELKKMKEKKMLRAKITGRTNQTDWTGKLKMT